MEAFLEPKDFLAYRWTDFSLGGSRASLPASPEVERDCERLDRADVGELGAQSP